MTTRLFTKRLTAVSVNGSSRRDLGRPQVRGFAFLAMVDTNRDAIRRASLSRSFYSDAAGQAVLSAGAGKNADRVGIAYHGLSVECDLWARGRALLAGSFPK